MGKLGILGLTISEEYGGVGASVSDYINAYGIISRECSTGVIKRSYALLILF